MLRQPVIRSALLCALLAHLCCGTGAVASRVWYVNRAAGGQNSGTSWVHAFRDLQDALAVAQSGDQIWVAAGTYKPDRGTGDRAMAFELPCGVELYGGFAGSEQFLAERDVARNETILSGDLNDDDGPWNCPEVSTCCDPEYEGLGCDDPECEAIVCAYRPECCSTEDPSYWAMYCAPLAWWSCCHLGTWGTCEDSYRTVAIQGCDGALLDGVLVVGGYRNSLHDGSVPYPANAGIASYDAEFTVSHSTFRGTKTWALLADYGSRVVLTDCVFEGRIARVRGGGLTRARATVERCRFEGGGELRVGDADVILRNSRFIGYPSSAGIDGGDATVESCEFRDRGALHLWDGRFTVSNCTFVGAGWLSFQSASATVDNCVFVGGRKAVEGGGSDVLFRNCVFLNNANTAISWGSGNLYVLNCAIVGNGFENRPGGSVGGAIWLQEHTSAQVLNSILWGNGWGHDNAEDNQIVVRADLDEYLEIDNSIVEGWTGRLGGTGNFGDDPLFADLNGPDAVPGTADDGARLSPGSPAINAGFPSQYLLPTDLDGHPRVLCGAVDIGAYEFGIGDFDCNQAVDLGDFAGWSACMTGPDASAIAPGCEAFDFNADDDIDLHDLAALQRCFTSEELVATDTVGIVTPMGTAAAVGGVDPCCRLFDLDEDDRVTIADLPALERILMGP